MTYGIVPFFFINLGFSFAELFVDLLLLFQSLFYLFAQMGSVPRFAPCPTLGSASFRIGLDTLVFVSLGFGSSDVELRFETKVQEACQQVWIDVEPLCFDHLVQKSHHLE